MGSLDPDLGRWGYKERCHLGQLGRGLLILIRSYTGSWYGKPETVSSKKGLARKKCFKGELRETQNWVNNDPTRRADRLAEISGWGFHPRSKTVTQGCEDRISTGLKRCVILMFVWYGYYLITLFHLVPHYFQRGYLASRASFGGAQQQLRIFPLQSTRVGNFLRYGSVCLSQEVWVCMLSHLIFKMQ